MNGVIGMTDYLLTTDLNADQRESAETVRSSAERLMTQIDRILDFSRLETGSFTPAQIDFNVRELARELITKGEGAVDGKPISLKLTYGEDVPERVRGDRSSLRRALWNLVENAIRFTSEGEVIVHLACDRTGTGPSTIRFAIRDSGMGISPAEQARLFDPFAQIENSLARTHEGLGLGLSTTKRLVERMDGRITVDSQLGKGSLFTILVPMEIVETPEAEMAQ